VYRPIVVNEYNSYYTYARQGRTWNGETSPAAPPKYGTHGTFTSSTTPEADMCSRAALITLRSPPATGNSPRHSLASVVYRIANVVRERQREWSAQKGRDPA
jgi:hypothetical protein